jgi:metallo-beta-lactamase family protein
MARTSLQFLGAVETVTGSRFLLEHGKSSLLVDAGLYQGAKQLRLRNWEKPPFNLAALDAVILTHSHIDHCGFLPRLFRYGYRGPIFATERTIALAKIVLPDAGRLQEEDAEQANRHEWSKHKPALPLFTEDDANQVAKQLRPVTFDEDVRVTEGFTARFQPAGHILGSASVTVTDLGGRRVSFSGDLGQSNHPLLRPPAPRPDCDELLIESTYGDRSHTDSGYEILATEIRRTLAQGGTVVIPAFAVDRTELLLHSLKTLERSGEIPSVPIIVDSPMALAVLDVYRQAIDAHDVDLRPGLEDIGSALTTAHLLEARTVEDSKEAVLRKDPRIIISASGMATGGRVLHHLKKHLPDARSTVILPGFQAMGTRGRLLADGAEQLKIHGTYVPVRAQIVTIDSFSAHADVDELLLWAEGSRIPETAFVVHGELEASDSLARHLRGLHWNAVVPRFGERVLV